MNRAFRNAVHPKDDFDEDRHFPFTCRFCGKKMFIYKKDNIRVWWGCDTEGCPGNWDTKRPNISKAQYKIQSRTVGDTDKLWHPFYRQARQVI